MSDKFKGYVIAYKDETNQYLDHYDCGGGLKDAVIYHHFEDAEEYRKNIDVAYLFEVKEIEIAIR